jgi:hypothetical protein
MADRYWRGGTANWDGTAGSKWAATPAGATGASVPTTADDVFFDSTSTGTCTISVGNTGAKSINCTGFTGTLAGTGAISVAGGVTLVVAMGFTYTGTLTLTGTGTLTTADKTLGPVTVNGAGITVSLGNALTMGSTRALTVTQGSFNTANFDITTGTFVSSNANTRSITLGTSTINLSGTGTVWNSLNVTNLTFSGASSTINLTDTSTTARTFAGGALTYGTVNIGGTTGISTTTFGTTASTINTLSSTKTVAHTITFSGNQNITNWTVTGTAGNVVTVNSSAVGTQRTITYTGSAVVSMDYMSIRDINFSYGLGATVPYLVYAGANSTNLGNNNGILFRPTTVKAYQLTTGTGWTVPADWNNSDNTIHLIGAGGGGADSAASGDNRAAGAGGGGGGYTVVSNFSATPSSSVAYTIGASVANADGGDTGIGQNTISFVASTTLADTAGSTTHVMDVPAGTADGDLMVLFIVASNSAVYTVPTGWTAAFNSTSMMSCYRTASSEPASYTVTTNSSFACSGYIATYTNAQFDTVGTVSLQATPTVAPSINVAYDNSVVLDFAFVRTGSITFTTPTGFSSVASESNATIPSSALFSKSFNAGATGTVSTTPSSSTGNSILLAIRPSSAAIAGGGKKGTATTVPTSAGGAGGTGVTFNGGTGGAGGFGTAASTGYGSGAGGGAGGPNGAGGAGGNGFGSTIAAQLAGGGGGGNGGGSNGGNASLGVQGNGGNNFAGAGGGATNGASGTVGGGGAGGVQTTGGAGGSGIDIANTIGGAGGVGGAGSVAITNAGLYGGGGAGGRVTTTGGTASGAAGSQGVIFIVYTPASSNFLTLSGVTINGGVTLGG